MSSLEVTLRFELRNRGFAIHCLTTWLYHRLYIVPYFLSKSKQKKIIIFFGPCSKKKHQIGDNPLGLKPKSKEKLFDFYFFKLLQ
jgi:hypothetical protein